MDVQRFLPSDIGFVGTMIQLSGLHLQRLCVVFAHTSSVLYPSITHHLHLALNFFLCYRSGRSSRSSNSTSEIIKLRYVLSRDFFFHLVLMSATCILGASKSTQTITSTANNHKQQIKPFSSSNGGDRLYRMHARVRYRNDCEDVYARALDSCS